MVLSFGLIVRGRPELGWQWHSLRGHNNWTIKGWNRNDPRPGQHTVISTGTQDNELHELDR
ncbi:protein of unknown function [Azospirillum baldaniorum]|uniref:Uncharacterized protein n=1 Tax=Azospirillum baldaniorum TaxID=1064539 RepID=A0A9P1NM85_9PROT|nr:protein of unknown function [Azospirillum baldaniorum]